MIAAIKCVLSRIIVIFGKMKEIFFLSTEAGSNHDLLARYLFLCQIISSITYVILVVLVLLKEFITNMFYQECNDVETLDLLGCTRLLVPI